MRRAGTLVIVERYVAQRRGRATTRFLDFHLQAAGSRGSRSVWDMCGQQERLHVPGNSRPRHGAIVPSWIKGRSAKNILSRQREADGATDPRESQEQKAESTGAVHEGKPGVAETAGADVPSPTAGAETGATDGDAAGGAVGPRVGGVVMSGFAVGTRRPRRARQSGRRRRRWNKSRLARGLRHGGSLGAGRTLQRWHSPSAGLLVLAREEVKKTWTSEPWSSTHRDATKNTKDDSRCNKVRVRVLSAA